ncbi:NADH-quinone oxidoreductase subunit NuoE [Candidatus Tisiphia endosymbiont of Nemotelus uliginosus]|uniref:NADH-quinone oxidoreductase subunit NuoE n=1 Tax=Candidatus Tisiphia endosymbiont of Nemotelus uliginosus TaxID=3077926 RepID=UPI0035C8B4BB
MNNQPINFSFNEENLKKAQNIIKKYPDTKQKSAILPLLDLAQRQMNGWLPRVSIEYVANLLGLPFIRAYEVATFYTMFNLQPVGQYHIQICGTTPCWLRGSDAITTICQKELGINFGELTADNKFSMTEVECLGACVNAPVVQINDDFFEDLNEEKMKTIINQLKKDS